MQILCIILSTLAVYKLSLMSRVSWKTVMENFYRKLQQWVLDESHEIKDIDNQKSVFISKKQDQIIKICVINQIILQQTQKENNSEYGYYYDWGNYKDQKLIKYLENEEKTQFRNVSLKDIRINCVNNKSLIFDGRGKKYPGFVKSIFH